MTMTMSSAELLRDQDFQAPTARTAGQGVEGLEELTDLEIHNIDDTHHVSVKHLLDKYRDHLTNPYDII